MKKTVCILLTAILAMSFCACGKQSAFNMWQQGDLFTPMETNGSHNNGFVDQTPQVPSAGTSGMAVMNFIHLGFEGKEEYLRSTAPAGAWDYWEMRYGYSCEVLANAIDEWHTSYYSELVTLFGADLSTVNDLQIIQKETLSANDVSAAGEQLANRYGLVRSEITDGVLLDFYVAGAQPTIRLDFGAVCYQGDWYICVETRNGWIFYAEYLVQMLVEQVQQNQHQNISYGNQVGQLCYGTQLQMMDGNGLTSALVDPTQFGTVTVINFWGTWCGYCLREMPEFDQLAEDYEGKVTIVAIHSAMGIEAAPDYIAENYKYSNIIFAAEPDRSTPYYYQVGGNGSYPYTIVINADGIITHKFLGAINYSTLENAVNEALYN